MAHKINTTRTGGSNVLKDGIYQLVVTDATEKTSSSGNEMVELQLAVVRGGRASGRIIFDNLVWAIDAEGNNKAQFRFDQFHDALEVEEGLEISCKWYKGKKVYASLVTDEYGGNVKNKVKTYLAPDIALDLLEKQAKNSDEDFEESDALPEPVKEPVAAARRGRPRQQPAEMEEEDLPF